MASVNNVTIVGNLGADPVIRVLPSGDNVANLSVATNEKWRDANGDQQEHTEWHRIVFFGKLADVAGKYLLKGNPVYVEGRLRTRKWTDKETGADRYSTDIIGSRMQLLGTPNAAAKAPAAKVKPVKPVAPVAKPAPAQIDEPGAWPKFGNDDSEMTF